MESNLFGNEQSAENMLIELNTKVGELTHQQSIANTTIVTMRAYMESMESRLKHEFTRGFETGFSMVLSEVTSLLRSSNGNNQGADAKSVVKELEKRTVSDKHARNFAIVRRKLERAITKYLMHDIPLCVTVKGSKNRMLTQQGVALYKEISGFTEKLAEASGRSKGYFTHPKRYARFYSQYNIAKLEKTIANTPDDGPVYSVFATIILNGYVKQYIDFLLMLLEEEKASKAV